MLKRILQRCWASIPGGIRLKIIRSTQKKFTVSVAAIITDSSGRILLLEHLLRPQRSGWGIPGGFINFGEQFEDAIRREMREEVGIELSDAKIVRLRTIGRHVEVMFRASTDDEPSIGSREICSFGWFAVDSMPPEMSEVQKSLVREILSKHDKSIV
ncbi:MAG TPA: NUDIX domain-containing protein [Pyrinomonadaceae bacterium]|nr:NUDIX domain-containing protein [Pyrinomonadaceae bacterium]